MKNIFILFITIIIASGCSKVRSIDFCEGVDTSGKGVNCGSKFEAGDLTAVINSSDNFKVEKISVHVLEIKEPESEVIERREVEVQPDKNKALVELIFIQEGIYRVKAFIEDKTIAQSDIQIVDLTGF